MKVEMFKVSNGKIRNQCYVAYKDGCAVLIDPAWDFLLINSFLKSAQLSVKGVLLTHTHSDHTDLASKFSGLYNCSIFLMEDEFVCGNFSHPNIVLLKDNQRLNFDHFSVHVMLTPGHTSGSTCFMIDHHLFTGDTIYTEGVGVCSNSGGDANDLYDSVQFIKNNIDHNTLIWPGHSFGEMPGKSINELMKCNIYMMLNEREHFVKFRLRQNKHSSFEFK